MKRCVFGIKDCFVCGCFNDEGPVVQEPVVERVVTAEEWSDRFQFDGKKCVCPTCTAERQPVAKQIEESVPEPELAESTTLYLVRRKSDGLYYHSSVPSASRHWQRTGKFYSRRALAQVKRAIAEFGPAICDYEVETWDAFRRDEE